MYRDIEQVVSEALENPVPPAAVAGEWPRVYVGADVNLHKQLPAPWYFHEDSGHYLTAAVTVARDPDSKYLNCGIYRIQLIGEKRLAIIVNARRDLLSIIQKTARAGARLPIAIAVGLSPQMLVAATMSVPFGRSEYEIAGALCGTPYPLAQGGCVDLLVPAEAEYLLEGYLDPLARVKEGPFTEYDLIASQETGGFPIEVTVVRTKEEPVFHSLVCTSLEMVSLIMPLGMTELAKTRAFLKLISPKTAWSSHFSS
jgi:2,5-furandicarboxylate decarboxylase 1